mgnify:CR=1 FL=1
MTWCFPEGISLFVFVNWLATEMGWLLGNLACELRAGGPWGRLLDGGAGGRPAKKADLCGPAHSIAALQDERSASPGPAADPGGLYSSFRSFAAISSSSRNLG